MLLPDKSLSCIEVDAQDILSLYKSSSAVSVSADGMEARPCQAFICGAQDQDAFAVFMALLDPGTRRTLVYTPEKQPENRDEYAELLAKTVGFAEEMGFSMGIVNLDYSRALREVILSDTRVIKPAKHAGRGAAKKRAPERVKADEPAGADTGKKVKADILSTNVPTETSGHGKGVRASAEPGKAAAGDTAPKAKGSSSGHDASHEGSGDKSGSLVGSAEQLAALEEQAGRLFEEKAASEEAAAEKLSKKREEIDRLAAAKTAAEVSVAEKLASLRAEAERHSAEMKAAGETSASEMELARAEVERLLAAKTACEGEQAEKLASLRREAEGLEGEKTAAEASWAKELAEARDEVDRLTAEKTVAEVSAAEKLASLRAEAERLSAEMKAAGETSAREMELARAEVERLFAAKTAAEAERAERLASLRREAEGFEGEKTAVEASWAKELAEARDEIDRLTAEKTAAEVSAAEKLACLRAEAERLSAEKAAVERSRAEGIIAAQAEVERLIAGKEDAGVAFERELASLRAEAEKLREENDAAEGAFAAEIVAAKESLRSIIAGMAATAASVAERLARAQAGAEMFFSGIDVGTPVDGPDKTGEKAYAENERSEVAGEVINPEPISPELAVEQEPGAVDKTAVHTDEADERPTGVDTAKGDDGGEERPGAEASAIGFDEVEQSVQSAFAGLIGGGVTAMAGTGGKGEHESFEVGIQPEEEDTDLESVSACVFPHDGADEIEDGGFPRFPDDDDAGESTEFRIDKSMSSIEYASTEDIVEIYQSLNVTRITPEGCVAQNSRAHVCVVGKQGARSVYIGILLTDNGRVLVYTPDRQPGTENYRKTLQDAVDFLETAGFLMDPLSLGKDMKGRAKLVDKIPVLRKVS